MGKKLTEEEQMIKKNETSKKIDKVFVIILVLFIFSGLCYAGVKMYLNGGIKFINTGKKKDSKKEKKEEIKGEAIKVDFTGFIEIVDDYFIDASADNYGNYTLNAIYDKDGKLLYESDDEIIYTTVTQHGNDLVFFLDEWENLNNNIIVYQLKGKKVEKTMELESNGTYYTPLYYKDYNYLLGFVEVIPNEEEDSTYEQSVIHYLDGTKVELGSRSLYSVKPSLDVATGIVINDTKNAVVKEGKEDKAKYGVVDLKTGNLVIGTNYEYLIQTIDGNYVAKQNGKTALIDVKTKKLLPYEYEFIDINDGFYVLGKNDKLAIYTDKLKSVTDFEFSFQKPFKSYEYIYVPCCSNFNSFKAIKGTNKYLLVINYNSSMAMVEGTAYNKEEAYLIDENGKYETIDEDDFRDNDAIYLYDSDNKLLTVFDDTLEKRTTISLKDYDIKGISDVIVYGDIVYVDSDGTTLYFDAETGEEAEEEIATYKNDHYRVELDLSNDVVDVYEKDEKLYDVPFKSSFLNNIDVSEDGKITITHEKGFVILK